MAQGAIVGGGPKGNVPHRFSREQELDISREVTEIFKQHEYPLCFRFIYEHLLFSSAGTHTTSDGPSAFSVLSSRE